MLDVRASASAQSRPNWGSGQPCGGGSGASCARSQLRWFVATSDRAEGLPSVPSREGSRVMKARDWVRDAGRVLRKRVEMKLRMIQRGRCVFHPDEVPMFAGLLRGYYGQGSKPLVSALRRTPGCWGGFVRSCRAGWGGWEFLYLGRLARDRLAGRAAAATLAHRTVRDPFGWNMHSSDARLHRPHPYPRSPMGYR
jgi:hypothetical protein